MLESTRCVACGASSESDVPGGLCTACLLQPTSPELKTQDAAALLGISMAYPTSTPLVPGYRLIERIGEGGIGEVWSAEQLATGRTVAIKYIKAASGRWSISAATLGRFQREIEIAARLDHPNIARVLDGGEVMDFPFCVMEFIEGETLLAYVNRVDPPTRQLMALMEKVADAVQHAHQRFIIHRDLKPVNIMVTKTGEPKLLDFGLAKALEGEGCDNMTLSFEGMIAGTPAYMAPEQATGDTSALDVRTDVYSLGVTLYVLLTGTHPYDVTGPPQSLLRRIATTEIRRPRHANPKLTTELEMVLLKALNRDPAGRYQTAGELRDDLRRWLDGYPLKAGKADWRYFTVKFLRRHRVPAVVATITVATCVGAVTYHILRLRREKDEVNRQAAAASAARGSAEALIQEMIGSLKADLEPLGRLDLLDRVAQSSRTYFERTPLADGTGGSRRQRAMMLTNLGEISLNRGQSEEARNSFKQSALDWQAAIDHDSGQSSSNEAARIGHSVASRRLAEIAIRQGDHAQAARVLDDELARVLPDGANLTASPGIPDPASLAPSLLREAALLHETRGDSQLVQRDYDAAAAAYESFLAFNTAATKAAKVSRDWRRETVWALTKLAQAQLGMENSAAAHASLEQAAQLLTTLRTSHPDDLQLTRDAALLEDKFGDAAMAAGDAEKARRHYATMTAELQKLCNLDPTNRKWLSDLAIAWLQEGDRHAKDNQPDQASAAFSRARVTFTTLITLDPTNLDTLYHLATTELRMGNLWLKHARDETARLAVLDHYRQYLDHARRGLASAPTELRWRKSLVQACLRYGSLLRLVPGENAATEATKLLEEARRAGEPLRHLPDVDGWLKTLERHPATSAH